MISLDADKVAREGGIEERNQICGDRLGGGEQIKAEGVGKGGWEAMERDEKPGSVRGVGVARQPLLPGETPMCALCAGQDVLRGCDDRRKLRPGGTLQANGFAADQLEPVPPKLAAGPISPHQWGKRGRFKRFR